MDRELQQALNAIAAGADPAAVAARMSSDLHRQALAAVRAGADPAAVSQRLASMTDRGFSVGDFARMAAQGATFGFADEIAGAIGAIGEGTYREARDASRSRVERLRSNHPILSAVAEGVGGAVVPLPGGSVASGVKGAVTAGRAARAAQAAKELAATGAIAGSIYGAGEAERLRDIPLEALKGGAAGGVGGGLFGAASSAVASGASRAGLGSLFDDAIEGAARDLGPEDFVPRSADPLPIRRNPMPQRALPPAREPRIVPGRHIGRGEVRQPPETVQERNRRLATERLRIERRLRAVGLSLPGEENRVTSGLIRPGEENRVPFSLILP